MVLPDSTDDAASGSRSAPAAVALLEHDTDKSKSIKHQNIFSLFVFAFFDISVIIWTRWVKRRKHSAAETNSHSGCWVHSFKVIRFWISPESDLLWTGSISVTGDRISSLEHTAGFILHAVNPVGAASDVLLQRQKLWVTKVNEFFDFINRQKINISVNLRALSFKEWTVYHLRAALNRSEGARFNQYDLIIVTRYFTLQPYTRECNKSMSPL